MKRKLLFSRVGKQWNSIVSKFLKLHKRIQSPSFAERYSEQQQKNLLSKLQSLFNRLERMQHQVGIKVAGTALFLMLASATASAQYWRPMGSDPTGKITFQGTSASLNFPRLAFADLDGDGNLDLFVAARMGEGPQRDRITYLMQYKNDGSGNFSGAPLPVMADGDTIKAGFSLYLAPTFADLDGDGNMDLYVGDVTGGALKIYKNLGSGVFTAAGNFQVDSADFNVYYNDPVFVDLDNDGDLDLFSCGGGGWVEAFRNDGGVFTAAGRLQYENGDTLLYTSLGNGHHYPRLAFADLDGDGLLDLYMGGGENGGLGGVINRFRNLGTKTFGPFGPVEYIAYADSTDKPVICGEAYTSPAFADVDGDGVAELWAADLNSNIYHLQYIAFVTGVTVDATANIAVGDTKQLTAATIPANATNQNLSWSSSNETVATVDLLGVVTGVAAGTATITVTSEDGGKTATCVVTVGATGISQNDIRKFEIYPNPVGNEFRIENAGSINRIEIANVIGQRVKSVNLRSGNETISTSELSAGIYFVKFISGNSVLTSRKIIKK